VLPRSRAILRRRPAIAALLALSIALFLYSLAGLGSFMAREAPLERADAIFVLAGTYVERPLEAADLYREGYAPRILLTRSIRERGAYLEAQRRGSRLPDEFDVSWQLLTQMGVPESAIIAPSRVHDNTAQEAATLREVALRERWTRVIVVSSKYHLRRVGVATRRALSGTPVEVVLRGTRYDPSVPERWWRRRADLRFVASEVPKLVLYAAGVGG
jgi:uncharacterized SAM-binding protein YcdF (DUF218 family)